MLFSFYIPCQSKEKYFDEATVRVSYRNIYFFLAHKPFENRMLNSKDILLIVQPYLFIIINYFIMSKI